MSELLDKLRSTRDRTKDKPFFARKAGMPNEENGGQRERRKISLRKALLTARDHDDAAVEQYQRASDDLYLAKTLIKAYNSGQDLTGLDDFLLQETPLGESQAIAAWRLEKSGYLSKAMDTQTTDEGIEFVPDEMSSQLRDAVRLPLKAVQRHAHFNMPRSPYTLPIAGADITGRKITERLEDTITSSSNVLPAITPVTGEKQFTAKTLGAMVVISKELEAESIIPVVQFARTRLQIAVAHAAEYATINGVESGTHIDADIEADANKASHAGMLWNGYRYLAKALDDAGNDGLVNGNNKAIDIKLIRHMRKQMGKYGATPSDLMVIVGTTGHTQMLDIDELVTVDKFGPQASIRSGMVGMVDGMEVVVSEHIREDLDADGYGDNPVGTDSHTVCIMVHKPSLEFGDREKLAYQVLEWPITRQKLVILTQRMDLQPVIDAPTSDSFVQVAYNIPT